MNSKSNRQKIHERHRKQKIKTNLMWGGIGVVVIAIFSIIIWQGVRPAARPFIVPISIAHLNRMHRRD